MFSIAVTAEEAAELQQSWEPNEQDRDLAAMTKQCRPAALWDLV